MGENKNNATQKRNGLPDVFSRAEALKAGLTPYRLYALRDAGYVIPLGGGVYRWTEADPADLDLIEIAERVPRATICLETALARHGLLDNIPNTIDIAIPRGNHRANLNAPTRLHYFARPSFDVERATIKVGARTPLGIYSPGRSVIDMIRLRHNQGAELAWQALRRWLQRPGATPAKLIKIAKHFRGAEKALRAALEIVQ